VIAISKAIGVSIESTENEASSTVACLIVYTELLPGNALIKSVTVQNVSLYLNFE
jgi:hypothetical protein